MKQTDQIEIAINKNISMFSKKKKKKTAKREEKNNKGEG